MCFGQTGRLDLGDFVGEQQDHFGIFVADIEISVGGLDDPGRDQHALDEAMRIALEIIAILERARLAFVAIDREQARRRLGAHQRPFAPGRKAGAAEAAQAGIADELDDVVARARAADAGFEQLIAAAVHIGVERGRRRIGVRMRGLGRRRGDFRHIGLHDLDMADRADRRAVAGAHARRAHHPHVRPELFRQVPPAAARRRQARRTTNRTPAP